MQLWSTGTAAPVQLWTTTTINGGAAMVIPSPAAPRPVWHKPQMQTCCWVEAHMHELYLATDDAYSSALSCTVCMKITVAAFFASMHFCSTYARAFLFLYSKNIVYCSS